MVTPKDYLLCVYCVQENQRKLRWYYSKSKRNKGG